MSLSSCLSHLISFSSHFFLFVIISPLIARLPLLTTSTAALPYSMIDSIMWSCSAQISSKLYFFFTENVAGSVPGNEDRPLRAEAARVGAALFPELTHEEGDDGG